MPTIPYQELSSSIGAYLDTYAPPIPLHKKELSLPEQVILLLESPQPFRDWLDQFEDEQRVGMAQWAQNCPLARFLNSHFPDCIFKVLRSQVTGYSLGKPECCVFTPKWASAFICAVDTSHSYQFNNRVVTSKEAR